MARELNPWAALGALCIGFFMIVLDMTIVAVANASIVVGLHADVTQVVWVTSAYLLAFAVPLLLTGRLGDRYGPKKLYLAGLTLFTAASLWCGVADSIGMLIVARAVQGFGAALLTPQTMAVITRTFPAARRTAPMAVWGAVAGVANLAGPLLGGVLVDGLGWHWIFLVNVPVGLIAIILAVRLVPDLPTHHHRLDLPGVVLSGVGLFLLVFGLQEGPAHGWDGLIWALIAGGVAFLALFVLNQSRNKGEPLLPLVLFRDRNFALANIAIAVIGAAVAAVLILLYFYLQVVRGMSPGQSAVFAAPMAGVTLILAPVIGRFGDRYHPRTIPTLGFLLFLGSVGWFAALMTPRSSTGMIAVVAAVTGAANACIWAPLAATATHNLPETRAGAGSGVYNAIRQVGAVLGSASVAAVLAGRLAAHGVPTTGAFADGLGLQTIPAPVRNRISESLAESMYLPLGVLALGVVAVALFGSFGEPKSAPADADGGMHATEPSALQPQSTAIS